MYKRIPKKWISITVYFIFGIVLVWLFIASARIYTFTKKAENLIGHMEPFEQRGDGSKTVLFIGDSFAYGTGASSPDSTLAGLMGKHWQEVTIINKSKNGTKSVDLAKRIITDIDKNYDIIVVIVGANDIIHPEVNTQHIRSFYSTVYSIASKNADNVIAVTTGNFKDTSFFLWPLNHYFGARSHSVNEMAKNVASNFNNVTYIDAFDSKLYPSNPKIFESGDRLHPNDLGTYYWFNKILDKTNNLTFERS